MTLWKTYGFKPILWEVQERVKPANPLLELPLMEPWCDPKVLEKTLQEGGFGKVEFSVVKEGLWGKDKEDFKLVCLENFGAMVARNWADEEKAKLAPVTAQVVDEMQDKFCVTNGMKAGRIMEAWVAVYTKSTSLEEEGLWSFKTASSSVSTLCSTLGDHASVQKLGKPAQCRNC